MAIVIRIIKYEGETEAVRDAIQRSRPLGVQQCKEYVMTIAEHYNELPPVFTVDNELLHANLRKVENNG